jgi:hypothetical protein
MNSRRQCDGNRVMQLMADRALFGLRTKVNQELERLLDIMPDIDSEMMDIAAAAVHLAFLPNEYEPLPEALYVKIHSRAIHELAPYRQDRNCDPD